MDLEEAYYLILRANKDRHLCRFSCVRISILYTEIWPCLLRKLAIYAVFPRTYHWDIRV